MQEDLYLNEFGKESLLYIQRLGRSGRLEWCWSGGVKISGKRIPDIAGCPIRRNR